MTVPDASMEDTRSEAQKGVGEPQRRLRYEDYTVGWICALPLELAAAEAMLDEFHETLPGKDGDSNAYTLGSIASHNIVMACLPRGGMGNNNAATAAAHMGRTFPSIVTKKLMVGIGGGVPDLTDVRLGDVVVGDRVVQHDFGKAMPTEFQRTAVPTKPPPAMLTAVSSLQASHARQASYVPKYIAGMLARYPEMSRFKHPGVPDMLFQHVYHHTSSAKNCLECDPSQLVDRPERKGPDPKIHHGIVASGNVVVKDGIMRNRLAHELEAICFEMEAAGLGEQFPCLVVRGICDYADSHKNKEWQEYAAAAAAAYAKELLVHMPAPEDQEKELKKMRKRLHKSLAFEEIESRQASIKAALGKTCEWFYQHPIYREWLDPNQFARHHGFLWLSGKPGAGKSTIMKFTHAYTAEKWKSTKDMAVISFFFNARGTLLEKSPEGMYRSLLYQIFDLFPDLLPLLDGYIEGRVLPPDVDSSIWKLERLTQLFRKVVKSLETRCLICFVDALDECDEDQVREMVELFEELGEQALQNKTSFYACFSSRHYPHIELQSGTLRLTLEDQHGHSQDIAKYVREKFRAKESTVTAEIRSLMIEKAAGVFMWVVLVVEILNKELQRGRIAQAKRRLESLPPKLSDLFRDILTREDTDLDQLLLCIQWVLFAKRPLSCAELYFAIHAGLTDDPGFPQPWDREYETPELMQLFILSASKGLVEITGGPAESLEVVESVERPGDVPRRAFEAWGPLAPPADVIVSSRRRSVETRGPTVEIDGRGDRNLVEYVPTWGGLSRMDRVQPIHESVRDYLVQDRVQFIHESVRDFLVHDNGIEMLWNKTPMGFEAFSHNRLKTCCYVYTRVSRESRWPFGALGTSPTGQPRLDVWRRGPLETSPHRLSSTRTSSSYPFLKYATLHLLHHADASKPDEYEQNYPRDMDFRRWITLYNTFQQPEQKLSPSDTPEPWVFAKYNHVSLLQYWFNNNPIPPSVDHPKKGPRHSHPIFIAIHEGHGAAFKFLWENTVRNVNIKDTIGNSMLIVAAHCGHESLVECLLSYPEVNINTQDAGGQTALMAAAKRGHSSIASRLVRSEGIDLNLIGRDGRTVLLQSIRRKDWFLVDQILGQGSIADINFKDREGRTVLSYAAENGRWHTLYLLLRVDDLDKDLPDHVGITPLAYAVYRRHPKIVEQLIAAGGCNPNWCDKDGKSLLMQAVEGCDNITIRGLLNAPDLDINARDGENRTALHFAVLNGERRIASVLCREDGIIIDPDLKELITPPEE